MNETRTIRETIQRLAGTHQPDGIKLIDATVNSYDEPSRTCDVTAITGIVGEDIPGVRLMSDADDGILLLPTVGSTITIARSAFTDPVMIACSGLDKIILMGGDLGGLVMLLPLLTKLNNLENLVNDLITKFNAHTHNVTAVGSPTGPNLLPESDTLTPTERDDLENLNITQG